MDPVVDRTRRRRRGATLGMGWRLILARATAHARWILSVTRYIPNLLTGGVSNRLAQDFVHCVAVSHDGRWVVSGSGDHGVRFWDAKSGVIQLMLQGHSNSGLLSPRSIRAPWTDGSPVLVLSIDFSPAGNLLATGSADRQVRICESRYSPEFSLASIC